MVYCNRQCAAGGKRKPAKPKRQKVAEKAAYDRIYRAKNLREIKRKKAEHFKLTYDPVKAAIERKKTMPRHVAYCRRPEYRKKKQIYDVEYHARRHYGPMSDSALILKLIDHEVAQRMSDYEIRLQQGTLNKMQKRKKALYEKTRK